MTSLKREEKKPVKLSLIEMRKTGIVKNETY